MDIESFEQRLIELWMTTRIPFTRANLQFLTGAPRKKLEPWLDKLVVAGVIDSDVDDRGELLYTVRGAERPANGVTSPAELEKMGKLRRDAASAVGSAATALVLRREVGGGASNKLATKGDKSLVASGLLSFFFGPLGWLYAGHWREAIPAAGGYALAYLILPKMLLLPILGLLNPISALVGVGYAWKYNRAGKRQKILPEEPKK